MHTVETVRGSHVRLFEDDAVKCNSCGREGVIKTCDGIATVLWETDEERAEGAAMTSKSTITRERLSGVARGEKCYTHDDVIELALAQLAAMDSEPVADVVAWSSPNEERKCDIRWRRHDVEPGPLYRHAQSAPVVATFEEWCKRTDQKPQGWVRDAMKEAYDGAAAAMLQAGNSPVIPDGYVMVPKEPTQAMCAAFNDSDYGRKSLRERYVAMLAAAPQEVK